MANPNPSAARLAKRAKNAGGDVQSLRETLWRLISRLEDHITESPIIDPDTLKAAHALIQAGGVFLRTIEVGELESRLAALESGK